MPIAQHLAVNLVVHHEPKLIAILERNLLVGQSTPGGELISHLTSPGGPHDRRVSVEVRRGDQGGDLSVQVLMALL